MLSKNGDNTYVHDRGAGSLDWHLCLKWKLINTVETGRTSHPFNFSQNDWTGSYAIFQVAAGAGELHGRYEVARDQQYNWWTWMCHQGNPGDQWKRVEVKLVPVNIESNNETDARFRFITSTYFTDTQENLMRGEWEVYKKHKG